MGDRAIALFLFYSKEIMKIIRPTRVTDSNLLSSSVPENDYSEWVSGTAYNEGDKVILALTHTIYEALKSTTGESPDAHPLSWLPIGPTNRWAMFDEKIGTSTTATTSITFSVKPGIVSGIAFLDLVGVTTIRVKLTAPDGVIYDKTVTLTDTAGIIDWWTYFFEEVSVQTFVVLTDLPTYRSSVMEVTISGGVGTTVSVGSIVFGRLFEFANAVDYGASIGIQDYSRKERDDFGNVMITERAFSKRARWNFSIQNSKVDSFQRTLAELRATPAVYIGASQYDSMIIYGFYRDFDTIIAYPNHSECSIDLESLV